MEPSFSGNWSVQNRAWGSPVWFLISPHLGSLFLQRHNVPTCSIRCSTTEIKHHMPGDCRPGVPGVKWSCWCKQFPQTLGNVLFPPCLRLKMAVYTARDNHGGKMDHTVSALESSLSPGPAGALSFPEASHGWGQLSQDQKDKRGKYNFFKSTQTINIYLMD